MALVVKNLSLWVGMILWRRAWQPTPGFLPGESPGQRGLAGYSPWDRKESDMTEQRNMLLVNTITESLAHRAVTSLGLSVLFCEM